MAFAMAPLTETLKSLYGAYRLARFSSDGLVHFNVTPTGFLRSFSAAAIVAPFFLTLLLFRYSADPEPPVLGRYLALEAIAYVISWCAFPLIMDGLSRSLDRRANYIRFVTAYNWSMVPQNVIYIVVIILGYVGVLSEGTTNGLALMLLVWSLAYTGFVAKTALDVPPMTAGGIVVVDFLLSLCIEVSISSQI
jgi:hypothetical protein